MKSRYKNFKHCSTNSSSSIYFARYFLLIIIILSNAYFSHFNISAPDCHSPIGFNSFFIVFQYLFIICNGNQ